MRRTIIIVATIILPIFIGSGMIGIAVSGDLPKGTPFEAIWDAIDNIGDSHWAVCGDSICTEGGVGIGTNIPAKKLKVLGDAMFVNTSDDTYFFIEDQEPGVKSVGAYSTTWETLWIDGLDIILNYQSGGNVGIGTASPLSKLAVSGLPTSPPDDSGNAGVVCVTNNGNFWLDNDGTNDCIATNQQ